MCHAMSGFNNRTMCCVNLIRTQYLRLLES